mgnify:FL=1
MKNVKTSIQLERSKREMAYTTYDMFFLELESSSSSSSSKKRLLIHNTKHVKDEENTTSSSKKAQVMTLGSGIPDVRRLVSMETQSLLVLVHGKSVSLLDMHDVHSGRSSTKFSDAFLLRPRRVKLFPDFFNLLNENIVKVLQFKQEPYLIVLMQDSNVYLIRIPSSVFDDDTLDYKNYITSHSMLSSGRDADDRVVDICLVSDQDNSKGWDRHAVYALTEQGKIISLCPILFDSKKSSSPVRAVTVYNSSMEGSTKLHVATVRSLHNSIN